MTKPSDRHILSEALDSLGRGPLSLADDETLISAAQEVWYEHSSLESELRLFLARSPDEVAVRRAGYFLEKLTRFTCLSEERASEALYSLSLLLKRYRSQDELSDTPGARLRERRDRLALCWGLDEGLGLKIQTLLPYQTRHYAASRNDAFK
ncbi:hypothetical protein [Pseudomonas abietaniphila]|uniref:Uncharacterized protein n=1 Tax=Pseudomonas abietaniphila TaxID=89065 RepID=A0A1G7R3D9_9PSED|nr:hypothetical protein [Pseudomonas abietaniphila]SDG05247.1 hypothetical protein SAMN05216605_10118 [Pseudomonas abietaniphila]